MTLSTTINKVIHAGNDTATEFSFSFKIPTANDLVVIITDTAGTETTLTSSEYDVTGLDEDDGGTVTYPKTPGEGEEALPPLPTGYKITILREMDLTQETDFTNFTAFYPETVEERLDIITMQIQQVQEEVDRAVKLDISSSDDPDDLIDDIYADVVAAGVARTAAEAAQAAAELAETNAETAETNAETAQGLAETAQSNAEAAQGLAETAQLAAEMAQGLAETARDDAQGYASDALGAKEAAETAQGLAETAQGLAEGAKTDAETAQGLAETAQGLAEGAKTDAETAQGLAEGARDDAQGYASSASGYLDDTIEYYNAITKNGLVKVRNATGSTITAKIVKVVGDYATDEVPTVSALGAFTDRAIAYVDSLATDTTGDVYKSGRLACTGFDCSGAVKGDKVYCNADGTLTLTPTALEVGIVEDNANPGIVFFNIGGAGGGGSLPGDSQRLAAMDIDGSTNAIDTDKALYTVGAGDYIEGLKLTICNRNGGYTAKVRVAHIDGGIGDIADEDYVLYDDYLLPYETKVIEIDGAVPSDTLLVRSNTTNVNFILTGEIVLTDNGLGRVGAIEIDGTSNTVDTDYEVFTATEACKVNILVCNRNAADPVEVQLAIIDSDDVADIADEDRLFFSLDVSQTIFIEGEFNLAIDEMISFRSSNADVNCIVYMVN